MAGGAAIARLVELGYRPEAVRRVLTLAGGRFESPGDIARVLDNFPYEHDWAGDYQIRSAQASLMRPRIMCINAAILSYALLDCFPQVKRSLLAMHRRGPDGVECGHVVTAWWAEDGRVGAFSKSNFSALDHRAPRHASLEGVALSYALGYLGMGYVPLYFGTPSLDALQGVDWRLSGDAFTDQLSRFIDAYEYAFELEPPDGDDKPMRQGAAA